MRNKTEKNKGAGGGDFLPNPLHLMATEDGQDLPLGFNLRLTVLISGPSFEGVLVGDHDVVQDLLGRVHELALGNSLRGEIVEEVLNGAMSVDQSAGFKLANREQVETLGKGEPKKVGRKRKGS